MNPDFGRFCVTVARHCALAAALKREPADLMLPSSFFRFLSSGEIGGGGDGGINHYK
jgi:hypothetical protein